MGPPWTHPVSQIRVQKNRGRFTFVTGKSVVFAPTLLANGNVMVPYKDESDGKGKIAVYNDAGDLVVGATVFADTLVGSWRLPATLTDDNALFIGYTDNSDSKKAKYVIMNADGTVAVSPTALKGGVSYPLHATNVATVNKLAILYKDTATTSFWFDFLSGF